MRQCRFRQAFTRRPGVVFPDPPDLPHRLQHNGGIPTVESRSLVQGGNAGGETKDHLFGILVNGLDLRRGFVQEERDESLKGERHRGAAWSKEPVSTSIAESRL